MTFLTKKETRKTAREEWRRFLHDVPARAALLDHLTSYLESQLRVESRLLISIALPDELDCLPALGGFTHSIYAPITRPKGLMEFRLLSRHGRIPRPPVPGHMNIPGPPADAEMLEEPLHALDIALIPSLGADAFGRRLGRGGGYYDRWKNRLIPAHKIALLPETLTDLDFPAEEHDLRLDGIITPDGFKTPKSESREFGT